MLNRNKILSHCKNEYIIYLCEETASTNDDLAVLARNGATSRTVVIAERQTKGKGRGEHTFFSPDGGLYMSVLYREGDFAELDKITAYTACAVSRAIENISGKSTNIKWINDIFINGKKVCGILTRSEIIFGKPPEWVVIGIGINLTEPENGFPEDIKNTAGAVFEKCDSDTWGKLIAVILDNLTTILQDKTDNPLQYYRSKCNTVGRTLSVKSASGDYFAFGKEIDESFALIVETPDGKEIRLTSGEVSVR